MREVQVIEGLTERIEQAIWDSGMSLTEICDKAKISRAQLWNYRFYRVTPSALVLARLAVTLRVTSDWLLGIGGKEQ